MNKNLSFLIIAAVALVIYVVPIATTHGDNEQRVIASSKGAKILPHMRITAYSSSPDETDDTPFTTAMGTQVRDGVVATNLLPFGTKIKIPELFGNKVFTVEDRMNRRMKDAIDIWMTSKQKALVFGVDNADIVILNKNTKTGEVLAENNSSVKFSNDLAESSL